jgi:hypothetical protein
MLKPFLLPTEVVSKLLERYTFNSFGGVIPVSKSLSRGLEKCRFHLQQRP